MICLTPITVEYPKGSKHYIGVPCGKCVNCLKTRANDWVFRLKQEWKVSKNAFFITLTYADECLPRSKLNGLPQVCKTDVQKFFKRLRKNEAEKIEKSGYKIRYYLVSEYGGNTHRPHYHALLFNLPCCQGDKGNVEAVEMIYKAWKYGAVKVQDVTPNRIAYCAHYSTAWFYDEVKGRTKTWMVCSKRPPIGEAYLFTDHAKKWLRHTNCLYDYDDDKKVAIPRYYREKLIKSDLKKLARQKAVHEYVEKMNAYRKELSPEVFEARLVAANENLRKFIKSKKQKI